MTHVYGRKSPRLLGSATPARSALALALMQAVLAPLLAAEKSWNAGSGPWSNAFSWSPLGVPGGADTIRIGNLPGIQNGTVTMGHAQSVGYGTLEISDGMTLDMAGTELVSFGVTTITGANSRLIVRPRAGLNVYDFQGILHLETGGEMELHNDVPVEVFDDSWSSGTISGWGSVLIVSSDPFINNGVIRPDQGKDLVITQFQADPEDVIDLDGSNGNGELQLDQRSAIIEVNAGGLADSFSGTISMVSESELEMYLDNGWTADGSSLIDVQGLIDISPLPPARIEGYPVVLAGDINVGGFSGHLLVTPAATLQSGLQVNIGSTDRLDFSGQTTINGGDYTLGNGAQIDFNGATTVHGGTFNTFGVEDADGDVDFNGPTTWAGNITINGRAQQNGDATVSAATVITADVFDFGGVGGGATWDIEAPITINADEVQTEPLGFFTGEINIGGNVLNRLTVNRTGAGAGDGWVMDGVMNLSGSPALFVNRVAGAYVVGGGEFNIDDTKVEISAGLVIFPWTVVNFETSNSALRTRDWTLVRENATFNGPGTLINGSGGEMEMCDGAALDEVGLVNQGLLSIHPFAEAAGLVTVDRFTNDLKGTLRVNIAGHTLGQEYDHLLVTGGDVNLAGSIDAVLAPTGPGEDAFVPTVGDEFTIITAAGNVTGTFAKNPTSYSGAQAFQWSVVYGSNDVKLRLESVECSPCDTNCDGSVNQFDINPFIAALVNGSGCSPCAGDADANGTTNQFDISAFIDCLSN